MKTCSKCQQTKNDSDFYTRKSSTDGLRSNCKTCVSSYQETKKTHKRNYDKRHYLKNKDAIDARAAAYYYTNKKQKAMYDKKIRPAQAAKRRERYRKDVNYKLVCNLRSRLHAALKRGAKSAKTLELLGCSVDHLRQYIESKFVNGMCWEKVMDGEIHIDHIRPCASFDLTDPAQQRVCFHYSNLQPLWAKDNFKKSKKC